MKYAVAYDFEGGFYFIFFQRKIFHPKLVLDFIVSFANDFILYENYKSYAKLPNAFFKLNVDYSKTEK